MILKVTHPTYYVITTESVHQYFYKWRVGGTYPCSKGYGEQNSRATSTRSLGRPRGGWKGRIKEKDDHRPVPHSLRS